MQYCEDCKQCKLGGYEDRDQQAYFARCLKSPTKTNRRLRFVVKSVTLKYDFCDSIRSSKKCKNYESKNPKCYACEKPIKDLDEAHVDKNRKRICDKCWSSQACVTPR